MNDTENGEYAERLLEKIPYMSALEEHVAWLNAVNHLERELATARAEVQRVTGERDEANKNLDAAHDAFDMEQKRVSKLTADNAAMRAALEKYGRHFYMCEAKVFENGACTCGFSNPLATVSPGAALLDDVRRAAEVLKGVIRVADRKTVEFDAAKDALVELSKWLTKETTP